MREKNLTKFEEKCGHVSGPLINDQPNAFFPSICVNYVRVKGYLLNIYVFR